MPANTGKKLTFITKNLAEQRLWQSPGNDCGSNYKNLGTSRKSFKVFGKGQSLMICENSGGTVTP